MIWLPKLIFFGGYLDGEELELLENLKIDSEGIYNPNSYGHYEIDKIKTSHITFRWCSKTGSF